MHYSALVCRHGELDRTGRQQARRYAAEEGTATARQAVTRPPREGVFAARPPATTPARAGRQSRSPAGASPDEERGGTKISFFHIPPRDAGGPLPASGWRGVVD